MISMCTNMWATLWTIVCSCSNAFSVRHADAQWNTWIENTNTIDKYQKIVTLMLSDGIMHDGRLLVLNTFTADVRRKHSHIGEEVEAYKEFILSSY